MRLSVFNLWRKHMIFCKPLSDSNVAMLAQLEVFVFHILCTVHDDLLHLIIYWFPYIVTHRTLMRTWQLKTGRRWKWPMCDSKTSNWRTNWRRKNNSSSPRYRDIAHITYIFSFPDFQCPELTGIKRVQRLRIVERPSETGVTCELNKQSWTIIGRRSAFCDVVTRNCH